jgi:hypothetical protein
LFTQFTGGILSAEVGGLINGITMITPDDADAIFTKEFTVLGVGHKCT